MIGAEKVLQGVRRRRIRQKCRAGQHLATTGEKKQVRKRDKEGSCWRGRGLNDRDLGRLGVRERLREGDWHRVSAIA